MDLKLNGKQCLVTGASTGIGRATALALAAEGARVAITARTREPLVTLSEAIVQESGHEAVVLIADFAQRDSPRTLARELLAQWDHVDVLVNNAGGSRPLDRPDDEDAWEESFMLNFLAVRRLTEALVPGMLERGWGRIINLTGAIVGKTMNAAGPAKAAVESWSKASAALYASRGVTVNCIAPGRINSPQILNRLHPTDEARRQFIERNIPAGRFGEPEEAAALIAFVSSESASYITGTTIPVDGGTLRFAF